MSRHSPIERLFETVIAPEEFAVVGDEGGRAEGAGGLRFLGGGAERVLHAVRLRFFDERGVEAGAAERLGGGERIVDGAAFAELHLINGLRELLTRRAFERGGEARAQKRVLWKRLRQLERQIERAAN